MYIAVVTVTWARAALVAVARTNASARGRSALARRPHGRCHAISADHPTIRGCPDVSSDVTGSGQASCPYRCLARYVLKVHLPYRHRHRLQHHACSAVEHARATAPHPGRHSRHLAPGPNRSTNLKVYEDVLLMSQTADLHGHRPLPAGWNAGPEAAQQIRPRPAYKIYKSS